MLAVALALLLAAPPAQQPPQKVQSQMDAALAAVLGLQPFLAHPAAFRAKENRPALTATIDQLAALSHAFYATTPEPGVGDIYARQLARARDEFAAGQTDEAFGRLRGVTHLCMSCHVRERAQVAWPAGRLMIEERRLPPLERATWFALTRQTDRALATWEKALVQPPRNESEAYAQAEALRLAVSVAVRAADSPKATLDLLEPQLDRAELPALTRRQLKGWITEARAWQLEHFDARAAPAAQLFARAKSLIGTTHAGEFASNVDERYVTLLRAAAYLQLALEKHPTAPFRAEALYLLGITAASVDDPLLWQLEWLYLEACIRENPHSPIAQACADRLTTRTVRNYEKTAAIPARVGADLGELNALARPLRP